ncbi:hypothetical protein PROFUN_11062 [Planoprotostelium fungivorum]|uniref:Transmembrane 9 superfamily member n=1 Tax=Planoprotostelium fungivorum TaxID=1890364 RepID=A0A2P6NBP8_9EUKA|nr:hypothetical protein PROFUN_11062 [Planoprotostelium fungivorum]
MLAYSVLLAYSVRADICAAKVVHSPGRFGTSQKHRTKAMKGLLFVLLLCGCVSAWYFPGAAPTDYAKGAEVKLKANKMTSIHTQLPYSFYSLPFCKPKKVERDPENLGEFLRGDIVQSTSYEVKMLQPETCRAVCGVMHYAKKDINDFAKKIHYQYKIHLLLDNLPGAVVKKQKTDKQKEVVVYETGYYLGQSLVPKEGSAKKETNMYRLFNHINMKVHVHDSPDGLSKRVVGFDIKPQSINHGGDVPNCGSGKFMDITKDQEADVLWTYSVEWQESSVMWINRWDRYLKDTDPQIHWFSIVNSLMIVAFLTGMMAMIMMRTLHADFRRYNQETNEEVEETGWKLVHGDVFRPPVRPMLLSVLLGSGVQIFGMTLITMIVAALGFLSPANRGGLISSMVVLFVIMGIFAGYFSTRNFRMLKGNSWKKNTIFTALSFPGTVFTIFFILNMIMRVKGSSGAVPVVTLLSILVLWTGISTPLVFLGSYLAYKQPAVQHPVRTNQIPRQIPEQVWYMHPVVSILMGGVLPFGAIFIELLFIFSAIWGHKLYYIFGFLFMVFIILVLTCAEITIIMCYFQLCSEDYHWWWRSFLTSGASALYMFLYAIYYYTKLDLEESVSIMLYFGYTLIMSLGFFVLTGAIGYASTFLFVSKIYAQIKVD